MASNPQQPSVAEPMTEERWQELRKAAPLAGGPWEEMARELDRLRAENARLVEALKPFADAASRESPSRYYPEESDYQRASAVLRGTR